MQIGILAAGRPPRALIPQFGDYVGMFEHLLDGRGYDWASYDVPAGDYPDRPEACDAYIVTGAAAGVYDSDAWIGGLLGVPARRQGPRQAGRDLLRPPGDGAGVRRRRDKSTRAGASGCTPMT